MSYLNRENNYGETPGNDYRPYPIVSEKEILMAQEVPDLSQASATDLFNEIANRAVANATLDQLFTALKAKGAQLPEVVFDYFARQSDTRSARWVSSGSRDLSVLERAAELAGETGETVNVAKKLLRAELGMLGNYKPGDTTVEELIVKLETEMGDVLVCLLNLQNKVPGVNLLRGFRRAFNEKSEQLGFPERV